MNKPASPVAGVEYLSVPTLKNYNKFCADFKTEKLVSAIRQNGLQQLGDNRLGKPE